MIDKSDLDATSNLGLTALCLAALDGHLKIVQLLIKKGADPKHKAKNGLTPSDLAKMGNHLGVMKFIAENTK